jgi:hypothetical protein
MSLYIVRDATPANDNWLLGYMSADMQSLTDWHGNRLGSARVVTSWRLDGSALSDRMYQVECTVNGAAYTGRTLGASMAWRGRAKRVPFAKSERGKMRRCERRERINAKMGVKL